MANTYLGVDLGCTAVGKRPTSAVAVLDSNGKLQGEPIHFRKASELVEAVSQFNRSEMIIAIDAPRSVPDHTKENYAYRSCERDIKAVDPYAGSFSGAAALFIRWYEIESRYFQGVKVIETYPRVAWKHLGLPGKPKEFAKNRKAVYKAIQKITGIPCEGFSHHQVDAVLCAYTARCYQQGQVEWFGEEGEGLIFIPAPGGGCSVPPEAEYIKEKFRRFPCMAALSATPP